MQRNDRRVKLGSIILAEVLAVGTIVFLLIRGDYGRLPLAFGTLFLVLAPCILETLFRCRICLPVYLFSMAYAIGPMLGHCWKFYYTVPVWDKLLHISGGVMFAVLGAYFFELLMHGEYRPVPSAVFALCFSMAVAVLWEAVEFTTDILFNADMQDDVVIHKLNSYLLGDSLGVTGSIENIQSVSINGVPLPVAGYIDIGLIDTMLDMLLETLGAVITCVMLWLDKGRHPLIRSADPARRFGIGKDRAT